MSAEPKLLGCGPASLRYAQYNVGSKCHAGRLERLLVTEGIYFSATHTHTPGTIC